MPFGTPEQAYAKLRKITLDLPENIAFVNDSSNNKPALYLIGPLVDDGRELTDFPQIHPIDRNWKDRVVNFVFDGIDQGTYQVVFHASRVRTVSGDPLELTYDDGNPWAGWVLSVLPGSRELQDPEDETEVEIPDGIDSPLYGLSAPSLKVYLDGASKPTGSCELSGEVLTVETVGPADVQIKILPLLPGATSGNTLYERYIVRTTQELDDQTTVLNHFTSAGPMFAYKWAKYFGCDTEGTIPSHQGGILISTGVVRAVTAATEDPYITHSVDEGFILPDHDNSYDVVQYSVNTQNPNAKLSNYTTRKFVFPDTIIDTNNTPGNNTGLIADSIYYPYDETVTSADNVGVLDLPIMSRIQIFIDGELSWWGQTRMLPLLIRTDQYGLQTGSTSASAGEEADLKFRIWRASVEALSLWKCSLPTNGAGTVYVPRTMSEYVATRLAYGWPYENGTQGSVTVRVGDHFFQSKSDHSLVSRLQNLASLLEQCVEVPGIMPEDDMFADTAYLASEANPKYYPEQGAYSITQTIAPLISSEHLFPNDPNRYLDPLEMRRLPLRG